VIGRDRDRERGLERHVSSGSIGSSVTGRFTTPIDEEDPSFVFSMEEEDDTQIRSRKRVSGGHLAAASPLGVGWTYASAVSGKATGSNPGDGGSGDSASEAASGR
jgi:cleavage and polyadenylation specificity factor subunit 4